MNNLNDYITYWLSLMPEIENNKNKLMSIYSDCTLKNINENILKKKSKHISKIDTKYTKSFLDTIQYLKQIKHIPFVEAFMPIMNKKYDIIVDELKKHSFINNTQEIISEFIYNLYTEIYKISFRICIQELSIAKINNQLKGDSKEEEFNYYISQMLSSNEYLLYFYNEYPDLYSDLTTRATYLTDFFIKIINDINSDKDDLIRLFLDNNEKNFIVTKIKMGAGDSHQQGKSVLTVYFNNEYPVVYKPHELNIDIGFERFYNWLNKKNIPGYLQLQTPIALTGKNYGWVSYVSYKFCDNEQQMLNYYHRIGQLLSLLYLFDAKDYHHENIIANGEMPILIDLETLFHGSLTEKIHDAMENSVLDTMLLPRRIKLNKSDKSIDIGGISGFEKQESPILVPTVINQFRSDMKVIYTNSTILPEQNIPMINGQDVSKIKYQYVDEIISGFTIVYDWIISHKEEITNAIAEFFNESYCRLIIKSTQQYSTLLRLRTHPDLYINSINKEVFLSRIALSNSIKKENLINYYEHKDLMNGDIPYFYTAFNKSDIYNSNHNKIKGIKLAYTPAENFKNRINIMCERDRKKQVDLIYWSFVNDLPIRLETTNYETENEIYYNRNEILQIAEEIAEIIINNSILINNDCTWIGIDIECKSEEMTYVRPLSADLYKGLSGIALFFSYLYKTTQIQKYELFTRAVCHQLVHSIESLTLKHFKNMKKYDIGGFTGLGSIFYALYHISLNINDNYYRNIIIKKVLLLHKANIIDDSTSKDIIGGLSGYLMMLLSIYENEKDEITRTKFKKIILSLETYLQNDEKIDVEGYTGFAHGTSGAIATLIRINSHFPNNKRLSAIENFLQHERNLFNEQDQNWYTKNGGNSKSVAWCNGAAGMLLSRIILKKFKYNDDLIDKELDIAQRLVFEKGFGNNITLCHGDIGNYLILMEYANIVENADIKKRLNTLCHKIVHYINKNKDVKLYKTIDFYGLMTGKSGEGYFLLKLLYSDINNILFME